MAELATVAWSQQPVRELQTLEQAPIAGEIHASSAPEDVGGVPARAVASGEAEISAAPATKKRAGDIAECQCFGGIPVVVAGVLNSRGIACAQPRAIDPDRRTHGQRDLHASTVQDARDRRASLGTRRLRRSDWRASAVRPLHVRGQLAWAKALAAYKAGDRSEDHVGHSGAKLGMLAYFERHRPDLDDRRPAPPAASPQR